MSTFNLHNEILKEVTILYLFHKGGPETVTNLPKVSYLGSNQSSIWTDAAYLQSPCQTVEQYNIGIFNKGLVFLFDARKHEHIYNLHKS